MLIFVTKTNTADKLFFMRFLYANTFIIYFGRKKMKIEEKIDQTEKELNLKSQRIVMRNKVISVLIIVAIYITVFLLCGIAPVQFLKKWKWFLPIITVPLTALLSGKFLPINHETVHKEQRFKKENELKDLQNELEELRKRK